MSFDLICKRCGAPSSPSVGICPFCKTSMASSDNKQSQSSSGFFTLYNEGKLEFALSMGIKLIKTKPELQKDLSFVLCFGKVLFEIEAPSSKIRSFLATALIEHPNNPEILDYLEIIEAKGMLKKGINDAGEIMLKNLIRRSPKNVHAYFTLGTHLFWTDREPTLSLPYLEACVRLQPNFLRAWGCLAAIYKNMQNPQLAKTAFERCAQLETNGNMKEFFLEQASLV